MQKNKFFIAATIILCAVVYFSIKDKAIATFIVVPIILAMVIWQVALIWRFKKNR